MTKFLKPLFLMLVITYMCFINIQIVSAASYNTGLVYKSVAIKMGSNNAIVNGTFGKVDSKNLQVTPYISGDRTMVPVRLISEAFSANVKYDAAKKIVTIDYGNKNIVITIDSNTMIVNDAKVEMNAQATMKNERTYVPLTYITDALGMNKFYSEGLVIISMQGIVANPVTDAQLIKFINTTLVNGAKDGDFIQVPDLKVTLQSISAKPESTKILGVSKTGDTITVRANYSDGTSIDVTKKCKISSENKYIATVTSAYKLQSGTRDGTTNVLVSYVEGDTKVEDTIPVTVTEEILLKRIVATPASDFFGELKAEGSSVTVTAYYSNGSIKDVTKDCDFDPEDEHIAYVDETNYLLYSGKNEGEARIEVRYYEDDKEVTDTIMVTVDNGATYDVKLEKIVVTPTEEKIVDLVAKGSYLTVKAYYSDQTTKIVTGNCNFESTDNTIAYVSDRLRLTSGDVAGDADIRITYKEGGAESDATIKITVDGDAVGKLERIVATPTKDFFDDLSEEGSVVNVIAYYSDGSSKDMTKECNFETSDESIAYVDTNSFRLHSGSAEGVAQIKVTLDGEEKSVSDIIKIEVDENGDLDTTLKSISVTPSSGSIDELDTEGTDVEVTAYYLDGSSRKVTRECNFETEDNTVAYVSSDYELHSGNDNGEVDITVIYIENGIKKTDEITVHVR